MFTFDEKQQFYALFVKHFGADFSSRNHNALRRELENAFDNDLPANEINKFYHDKVYKRQKVEFLHKVYNHVTPSGYTYQQLVGRLWTHRERLIKWLAAFRKYETSGTWQTR